MKTITIDQPINLQVVKLELDFSSLYVPKPDPKRKCKKVEIPKVNCSREKQINIPSPPPLKKYQQKQDVKHLIEALLNDIYADRHDWGSSSTITSSLGSTAASVTSSQSNCGEKTCAIERSYLESLAIPELREQAAEWKSSLQIAGENLARCLRARDRLYRQQKKLCAAFTILLRHITGDTNARFGVPSGAEGPGEGGFAEWLHAMRLVARLPAGVPQHFRRKLWLTLAERHLTARGIDWPAAERGCFRGTTQPDDTELSAQILKDLHRTGCSLFCGAEGRENQAMLRRVLLAYARWNKDVGYCQGFNMLAAIILEVMEKSESDSLKVMVYLVEAVLPEGYFADDLRGLSADMAAFRDLLRLRLPRLAQHMDHLQRISDGGGVEPPLPDVFTMQWFLTLYATWLPRESLLRIWDLILLDGNEILLLTALAIWDMLQDRILSARSADEFYSCMGGGVGAVWEAGESLVARVVAFNSAPELPRLRSLHRYRVTPPAPPIAPPVYHPPLQSAMQSVTKRGLRLFYSEDEGDSSDDGNKMALATVLPRREDRSGAGDRLSLDIGALKRQYARLRERQRQAHVILAAACARHAAVGVPTSPTSLTVNNLLLGKSAIVSSRGRRLGPPPGAIPPSRQTTPIKDKPEEQKQIITDDTISWEEEKTRKSLNRRNSVKWKDIKKEKTLELTRKASIDLDEIGDGVIVSELEANELIASIRSRSSSESSTYSSRSESSTDTSLCDENEKVSDSESELPKEEKENKSHSLKNKKHSATSNNAIRKEEKCSPPNLVKESIDAGSSETEKNIDLEDKNVKDITEYLDSAAGEPLRIYIDGFDSKLNDTNIISSEEKSSAPLSPFKCVRHHRIEYERNDPFHRPEYEERRNQKNANLTKSNKIMELGAIDLSPCHCVVEHGATYTNDRRPSTSKSTVLTSRPPDIIDSFAMYPNFVPDIDLSDKNISDPESLPDSPGSESLIVSEDEPPIQLKIDKYFEHSPEFFGARLTDPYNFDIPSRRAIKRNSRLPKKPDSLTLQNSHNERALKNDSERASSLPQTHTFVCKKSVSPDPREEKTIGVPMTDVGQLSLNKNLSNDPKQAILKQSSPDNNTHFSKEHVLRSGRKNSERALQIIQENSQILSRILTKQNISAALNSQLQDRKSIEDTINRKIKDNITPTKPSETKILDSPLLKESTSDSLIGGIKRTSNNEISDKTDFLRVRPISIDDPFSFEVRNSLKESDEFGLKNIKTPSIESLGNKTDLYGWENKGFLAKCDYKSNLGQKDTLDDEYKRKGSNVSMQSDTQNKTQRATDEWARYSFSSDSSKISVTQPSLEIKDTSTYEKIFTSDDYNYPLSTSTKYNDFRSSKYDDVVCKIEDQSPKNFESVLKTEYSVNTFSDFSNRVTSSISFTCEPSVDDDSPMGAKSNSSDTLCQITSLDQVSTPISPKIFPNRETPTLPKDPTEKGDKTKFDSDDTSSAITSLLETDTLSSLSYPRSPSTGSYHPFPTRPAMRLPKDLGIRLGMYPKETISSPQK
ncbi:jg15098 [Pararge aegeria aegeria]|uniref:Jg15098 protein n=1 Tax=Pararge aegeria aegeria TaxID=348720 RepID=A0A8S4RJW1_9NEOP|nr:jg15098 [Pararge aegeria aegeria]